MFKFGYCNSHNNAKRRSVLVAFGIAEIVIGLMEMGLKMHESHALASVGAPFIAIGVIFLCRARQIPTL